jgi:hypothetical protein
LFTVFFTSEGRNRWNSIEKAKKGQSGGDWHVFG